MGNILKSLLGGKNRNKNPANAAMPYLNQVPGVAKAQFDPYVQRGNEAFNQAQPQYNKMSSDPMAFLNEIMQGYKPSEGFNFRKEQLQNELANTARAGGYRGTQSDQFANADLVNKLLSGDQDQYLQQVMGVLGGGLQGQENSINRGFGASGSLADILTNLLGSQATLGYKGQENMNETNNQRMSQRGNLLGAAAGLFGGPLGSAASKGLSGLFGGGGSAPSSGGGYQGSGYQIGSGMGDNAGVTGRGPNYKQFGGNLYKGRIL